MEIGALFKEMRAYQAIPGLRQPTPPPHPPRCARLEPRPFETCATFPGAAAAARAASPASSLACASWQRWQLASLNFKPASDPGCRRGETPRSRMPASSPLAPS
ncbi:unnamed protein product [Merluccius merluccius]